MKSIKVVVLNDNMGPYHFYRLKCANKFLEATAIQFSEKDHTNFWDNSKFNKDNVVTLFSDQPITEVPKAEIKKRIYEVLGAINPDVIVLSGWDAIPSLYALLWSISENKPTVVISESQEFDFKRNPLKELAKKQILKCIDSAFVGGINQSRYLQKLGFKEERIFEGCDIVDNDYFLDKSDEYHDRSSMDLPEKYFMTSCRFVKKKNLFFLIEAFSKFKEKNNYFKLLLVGDGPLKNKLEKFSKELSLENEIIFTGYKEYDQIKNIYSNASCFILPSLTEQWGLVVNESLASGIPVIASNRVGSAPNLIENNNVGYTFDPFSLDDLVMKMELIVDDLESIDFHANSRKVISKWGGEKYSKNIFQAANSAIDHHQMRGFIYSWFLALFIKLIK